MHVTITRAFCGYILAADDGQEIFVQSDWDHPGIASNFGWAPCHDETDGTIDCPVCGRTAADMTGEATQTLDDNDGATFDDPGYFDEEEGSKP